MALAGRGLLPTLDAGFASFLDSANKKPGTDDACKARNAILDERVSHARTPDYAASGAIKRHANLLDWQDQHHRYLTRHVALPCANALCPEHPRRDDELAATFRSGPGNEVSLADDHFLLRVVRFPRAVDVPINYAGFAAALRRVAGHQSPDPIDVDIVTDGLHLWDSGRANTLAPRWVGLWMEARELFGDDPSQDDPQWANRLRSRFGLAHRPVPSPVEVVLFRYRVGDLPGSPGAARQRMLAVPSLLDGWLFSYFCPAPADDEAGRAVNLEALGDAPNREYVHAPIRHTAANAFRVGIIDADPLAGLLDARRVHLDRVRAVNGRPDYAQGTDP